MIDYCLACGGEKFHKGTMVLTTNELDIGCEVYLCDNCGEAYMTSDQMNEALRQRGVLGE